MRCRRGLDAVGIDALGIAALEADQHRPVRAVAKAGQGERAVQARGDLPGCRQEPIALQAERELVCGAHRSHGMGARRPDADLEDIEDTQRHT